MKKSMYLHRTRELQTKLKQFSKVQKRQKNARKNLRAIKKPYLNFSKF